jgi:hypothetical protein
MTDITTIEQPITQANGEQPMTQAATTEQSTAQTNGEQQVPQTIIEGQPTTQGTTIEQPTGQTDGEQLVTQTTIEEQQAAQETTTEQPAAQTNGEQPAMQSNGEQPVTQMTIEEQPTTQGAATEQNAAQTSGEQPVPQTTIEERPTTQGIITEQPATQANGEQPVTQATIEEQPTPQGTTTEQIASQANGEQPLTQAPTEQLEAQANNREQTITPPAGEQPATNQLAKSSKTAAAIAKIKQLFGAPPILSAESVEAYEALMAGFIEVWNPKNHLDLIQIKHMTDDAWKAQRYNRHQIMAIKNREKHNRELEALRAKAQADRKDRKQFREKFIDEPVADKGHQDLMTDWAADDVFHEVDDILVFGPAELKEARAMEQCFDYYEKLEWLGNAAIIRYNDSVGQIQKLRNTFDQSNNSSKHEMIEGEFTEIEDQSNKISLVPSDESK